MLVPLNIWFSQSLDKLWSSWVVENLYLWAGVRVREGGRVNFRNFEFEIQIWQMSFRIQRWHSCGSKWIFPPGIHPLVLQVPLRQSPDSSFLDSGTSGCSIPCEWWQAPMPGWAEAQLFCSSEACPAHYGIRRPDLKYSLHPLQSGRLRARHMPSTSLSDRVCKMQRIAKAALSLFLHVLVRLR